MTAGISMQNCIVLFIHSFIFFLQFLSSMPRSKDDRVFVISCEEDKSVCKKPLEAGIPVVSAEVLLTGVLRQELNLEEYLLFKILKIV